jgi:hypothetical protein
VDRVRFIQNLYAAGLGSKAVLLILPCREPGVLIAEMHERLLVERARVQAQLEELTATRDKLDDVIRLGQTHREAEVAARTSRRTTYEVTGTATGGPRRT